MPAGVPLARRSAMREGGRRVCVVSAVLLAFTPQIRSQGQPPPVRGRIVGPRAQRHEFTRAETLRIRAPLAGAVSVTGQLLARNGQRLTDLPVDVVEGACEVTLPLPNLGPGDYVVQLSAGEGGEAARQYVAFRILR